MDVQAQAFILIITITITIYKVDNWDCRVTSRRQIQPDRRANLRKQLLNIDQARKETSALAVASATTDAQRKKSNREQTTIMSYGTSRFLLLLDDEPAPPSVNRTLLTRNERLARAEVQKLKLQSNLSKLLQQANCDHTYSTYSISTEQYKAEIKPPPPITYR